MSNAWLGRVGRPLLYAVVRTLSRRRRVYGPIAASLVVAAGLLGSAVVADHGTDGAALAAQRVQAARDRAAIASQAVVDAQSHIAHLSSDIAVAEQRLAAVREQIARTTVPWDEPFGSLVLSGASTLATLIDPAAEPPSDPTTAAADGPSNDSDAEEDVDPDDGSLAEDLEFAAREIEANKDVREAARREVLALAAEAEAAIAKLAEVEAHHLPDPAVEEELERLQHDRRGGVASQRAASAVAAVAARAIAPHPATPADAAPVEADADTLDEREDGEMRCPVDGEHTFVNTWGAPRSGGRRHQGVDMMASSGTPIVAVEPGRATFKTSRLGGRAIWLTGASGTTYYYAHLSDWEGSSRTVVQGEVIGYVGTSGNAYTPHLHFEVHPDGERAVSPYPYISVVC